MKKYPDHRLGSNEEVFDCIERILIFCLREGKKWFIFITSENRRQYWRSLCRQWQRRQSRCEGGRERREEKIWRLKWNEIEKYFCQLFFFILLFLFYVNDSPLSLVSWDFFSASPIGFRLNQLNIGKSLLLSPIACDSSYQIVFCRSCWYTHADERARACREGDESLPVLRRVCIVCERTATTRHDVWNLLMFLLKLLRWGGKQFISYIFWLNISVVSQIFWWLGTIYEDKNLPLLSSRPNLTKSFN